MSKIDDADKERFDIDDNTKFETKTGFSLTTVQLVLIICLCVALVVAIGLATGLTAPECLETTSEPITLSTASTAGPTYPPIETLRLPDTVKPIHYDLEMRPELPPDGDFTNSGWVKIRIECLEETNRIILHSDEIVVKSTEVIALTEETPNPEIFSTEYHVEYTFFIINLLENIKAGSEYLINITYEGIVNDGLHGLYRSFYTNVDGEKVWMAITQMESTYARKALPCFDEPHLKATFNTTLVRLEHHVSITNSPIYATEDREPGWVADKAETTVLMSTYLLAFVICDFTYVEDKTERGTQIRAWAEKSRVDAGHANFSLRITKQILEYFEKLFDSPYTMQKADLIAVPHFNFGAMENWGLVIYRDTRMLYDPLTSTARDKRRIEFIVAHEIAHMWFGNLVTCEWWTDIWLNEGFATYYEYQGADLIEKNYTLWDDFLYLDLHFILDRDSYTTAHSLVFEELTSRKEIEAVFDSFTYAKGGSINRMMSYFLGNETWSGAMIEYLNEYAEVTASTDKLWIVMDDYFEANDIDIQISEVMDSWTLQPGFPLLRVTRNYDDNSVNITQKRFLFDETRRSKSKNSNLLYHIPLMYVTEDKPEEVPFNLHWMKEASHTLQDINASDWLLINPEGAGYYRVEYDDQNYQQLIDALKADPSQFHQMSRANLINDAFTLARAGIYSQVHAMKMTEYMDKEEEYIPWKTALDDFIYPDTMLSITSTYSLWLKHMKKQIKLLFGKYGWDYDPEEDSGTTFKREEAASFACKWRVQECLTEASQLFSEWMDSPDNLIPTDPNHRETAYCYGIQEGGAAEWDFAWNQAPNIKTEWSAEYYRLLRAMACASEPWIINRYLAWTMNDSSIQQTDASDIIAEIANNNNGGRQLAWSFLQENWDDLAKSVLNSASRVESVVHAIVSGFNREFSKNEFSNFVASISYSDEYETIWEKALETINANIKYMDTNYDEIKEWLEGLNAGKLRFGSLY